MFGALDTHSDENKQDKQTNTGQQNTTERIKD
jgi:hypothetical protein